ncbi:MAG: hypothetical protein PHO20_00090 [Candidatus Peribacteraceae bacterium]|nr:hypothetical protein [Candidatus Peribacteraceae bacterium]MDD5739157.1 hypothetical protein [Candidatus Peribacteraceae bacterium]
MSDLSTVPTESPSLRLERVIPLPSIGRQVEDWMWKVLNGGKVPSTNRNGVVDSLYTLAVSLRTMGNNGDADELLSEEKRLQAAQYAQLLGWRVEDKDA